MCALALLVAALFSLAMWAPDRGERRVDTNDDLGRELEALRVRLRIPGMSAAIAEGDRISWMRAFGLADRDRRVAARPDSLFHLASLTKPYASTVLMQLVEDGGLDLEAPVTQFGIAIERSAPVKVWHLMSHTSDEAPGSRYRYDGNAYGRLTQVIERTTGRTFTTELTERIVRPLSLTDTAPNPEDPRAFRSLVVSVDVTPADIQRARAAFAASGLSRAAVESALAQGYARAWGRFIWPTGLAGPMRPMPHGSTLSTTSGLVASAADVARFSIAIDDGRLLMPGSRARAWTPPKDGEGRSLPYALGWFVQRVGADRIVWHYGHGFESSSLIVKIPDRRLTFVILANSDGLSRWRRLGDKADVRASPAATLFLNWYGSQTRRRYAPAMIRP